MKPAPFELRVARELSEITTLLAAPGGESRILAGGQSLLPMMNLRMVRPSTVIDITAVPELRGIVQRDGRLEIGATVTHAMIEDGIVPDISRGFLPAVASRIAYRGVRNRGTIGGSLAHMFPGADWPVALLALGAEVEARSTRGDRRLPLDEFGRDALLTALSPDEVLTAVSIPLPSPKIRWSYFKFCRKVGELAHAICAIVSDPGRSYFRVAMGGRHGPPFSLSSAEIPRTKKLTMETCEGIVVPRLPNASRHMVRTYGGTLLRAMEGLPS